jgi:CheY-like chemotaxis protein
MINSPIASSLREDQQQQKDMVDSEQDILEKRDAVYKPAEITLERQPKVGRRASLVEESAPYRSDYLEELKRDMEELSTEIIKTDSDSLKDILSLLTTKYAVERNILAHERNLMAEERSLLAEQRTQAALDRTDMAENRSGLARLRTQLAHRRVFLGEKRTMMAQQRTFLAKARTELAFIRTGVALIALATALIRYFGIGVWSIIDGSIFVLGVIIVSIGIYYYIPTRKQEGRVLDIIRQKEEDLMQRKPRIMVLDDDVAVCNSLKIYLSKGPWQVEAFTNPYVARQRLEAAQFDIVITDFMMKEMTGIEFLHHIQRLSPGTQVILISEMEMLEEFVNNFKNELFDSFAKPVNVKDLKASIKRALEERMMVQ